MAVHGSFCTERFQALYGLLQKELWLHRGGPPGARLRPTAPRACRKLRPALAPTARARSQPVCTMIHAMIRRVFVRAEANAMLAGASFDELVAFYTTSTIASGGDSIIIFCPPPYPPPQVRCSTEMRFSIERCARPAHTQDAAHRTALALHTPPHTLALACTHAQHTHTTRIAHARTHLRSTYARTHTQTMHECTNERKHACTHDTPHLPHAHTHIHTHTHAHTHAHTRPRTRVCAHACTDTHAHMHTHTHTHTHMQA